mgnify:CR=1 FL=1
MILRPNNSTFLPKTASTSKKSILNVCTEIQSNKEICIVFPDSNNCVKKQRVKRNERITVKVPTIAENPLLTLFPKNILKRNPTNGDKSNNKFIILYYILI